VKLGFIRRTNGYFEKPDRLEAKRNWRNRIVASLYLSISQREGEQWENSKHSHLFLRKCSFPGAWGPADWSWHIWIVRRWMLLPSSRCAILQGASKFNCKFHYITGNLCDTNQFTGFFSTDGLTELRSTFLSPVFTPQNCSVASCGGGFSGIYGTNTSTSL
jgi:hypothetical protein